MRQKGFTLLELILTITVIALIALFAIPRFVNVSESAETSSVQAIEGAMNSSILLLHSRFVVTGDTYDAEDIVSALRQGGANFTIENR